MKNVPKLNVSYWVLMLLCTTMGELIGNLLSRNFELGYTKGAVVDFCIFAISISAILFFRLKNEIFYWILILIGNIGGTNLADWVNLEPLANDKMWGPFQPLELGTTFGSLAVLGALLIVLFIQWRVVRSCGGDHSVTKLFYWMAILLSSTFGTTSGDFITNDTPLGAFGGSVLILVLLATVFFAYKKRMIGSTAGYWLALVLMHPVGATIGNWISKPIGLNLGNVSTNIFMILMFLIIYARDGRFRKSKMALES